MVSRPHNEDEGMGASPEGFPRPPRKASPVGQWDCTLGEASASAVLLRHTRRAVSRSLPARAGPHGLPQPLTEAAISKPAARPALQARSRQRHPALPATFSEWRSSSSDTVGRGLIFLFKHQI